MARFCVFLLLLSLSGVLTKIPQRPSSGQTFTNKELECFAQEKVLYSDGQCYKLLNQGPCAPDQWLVFDRPGNTSRPVVACKVRRCNTSSRPIYWPEDGECHRRSDKNTLCPFRGNQLRSDSYGEGECACDSKHTRFEMEVLRGRRTGGDWLGEGDCFPLFYRAPCPVGKILHPKLLEGFGLVGNCVQDLCAANNNGSAPNVTYVLRKEDRRCYKLDTPGTPCAPSELFAVHPTTNLPACYSTTTALFSDFTVRCGGVANINTLTGECREEVVIKAQTFGFEVTRKRPRRRTKH